MKNFFRIFGNLNRACLRQAKVPLLNLNRACLRQAKVPLLIIALVAVIGFSFTACDDLFGGNDPKDNDSSSNSDGTGNGTGTGNSKTPGSTKDNPILITVGYSSSHTISSSGEHWFKFTGTGDPVIFETTGDVVDTYMYVDTLAGSFWGVASSDNDGDGNNALCGFTGTEGETYLIKVTARNSTKGAYTFVVKEPTSNLRTNPISVSVGNSSSHTIFSSGTHWFRFTGTGDRVFFETEGNVVNTSINIYIGDSTGSSYSKQENKGINFFTVSGTTYYINITGNSGTYTFKIRNGTGDGSSRYNAIEVKEGHSSSRSITSSGEHWYTYRGTGDPVTIKTTGNVVDTYMYVDTLAGSFWGVASSDNDGDGDNALCYFTGTEGETYLIKVTARNSTSGSYTFVVE